MTKLGSWLQSWEKWVGGRIALGEWLAGGARQCLLMSPLEQHLGKWAIWCEHSKRLEVEPALQECLSNAQVNCLKNTYTYYKQWYHFRASPCAFGIHEYVNWYSFKRPFPRALDGTTTCFETLWGKWYLSYSIPHPLPLATYSLSH